MPYPVFPDAVNLEYPLGRSPVWKTLISASDGEVEQRVAKMLRPIENLDCTSHLMPRSEEADLLSNFFRRRRGAFEPFLLKTRFPRNIEQLYIGIGDGTRRVWQMPVYGWTFLTIRVNGVEKYRGIDYDIVVGAGNAGTDLIVFRTVPANGGICECDATDARQVIYVRFASDIFEEECQRHNLFDARFRLTEVKADLDPYADGVHLFLPLIGQDQTNLFRVDKGTGPLEFTRATTATRLNPDTNLMETVAAGVLREDGRGYLNRLIHSEDFGQAAWAKTDIVVTNDNVQGPDGKIGGAQTLQATMANGMLLQAIVDISRARYGSIYMKRKSGAGNVQVTLDGGATWTTVAVTSSWTRFGASQTVANPSFGVRIATSGDAVYISAAQLEDASTAGRYAKSGANPAYYPLGVLIEMARTNLALYSEQFSNAAWPRQGSTETDNLALAPDGNMTADAIEEDATTGIHAFWQSHTEVLSSTTYVFSIWSKKSATCRDWIELAFIGKDSVSRGSFFNIANGTMGTVLGTLVDRGIIAYPDGSYRCWIAATSSTGAEPNPRFCYYIASADNVNSFPGGGSNYKQFVWGAQIEEAADFPSSYIPTTAAAVARNTDALSIPISNVPAALGSSFFESIQYFAAATAPNGKFRLCTDTGGGRFTFTYGTKHQVFDGTNILDGPTINLGTLERVAAAWGGGFQKICSAGGTVYKGPFDGDMAGTANLCIGGMNGGNILFGHIRYVRIMNRVLTDAEMQAATS